MAKRKPTRTKKTTKVDDYRHGEAKRKNNPPAKIAAEGTVPAIPKAHYKYNPHLPPVLRFDETGEADKLPYLLEEVKQRPLDEEEIKVLANALRKHEPWLEWTGKREQKHFEVDPVALHIHERISAQAILKVAARQDVERCLFGDPQQEYCEAVQFYRHDIDWTNRLILGDSLQVMSSLARREDLAGKVQMIYIDPPYGIRFKSNFQPLIADRDVQDRDHDLTREVEMVHAYRDTWHLGVHSYLAYLRDRLAIAGELLTDTGSVFVQINEDNVHRVRMLLDEVFGAGSFCSLICYKKPGQRASRGLPCLTDYILWYSKNASDSYHQLYQSKSLSGEGGDHFTQVECPDGKVRPLTPEERADIELLPSGTRVFQTVSMTSGGAQNGEAHFEFQGTAFYPPSHKHWSASMPDGMTRLAKAERLLRSGRTIRYKYYFDDASRMSLDNRWNDVGLFGESPYVVRTAERVVERCILMTTKPGDLVLDPTCGGGTTAIAAEKWGRRWIAIDTSRVALAITRQRLLTTPFDYYSLRDKDRGVDGGFSLSSMAQVTRENIANNVQLDPVFTKHDVILRDILELCNRALTEVTKGIRKKLEIKLAGKRNSQGKRAISEADRRRWDLPTDRFEEWTLPLDTDEDWPKELVEAVGKYRAAWRAKMDEVNACIAANAEPVELVDEPEVVKGVLRVSGPFTLEAVQPPEISLAEVVERGDEGRFAGEPDEMETFGGEGPIWEMRIAESQQDKEVQNLEAYLDKMLRLLRTDGVRFPNNKQMRFTRLEAVSGGTSGLHAEGRWVLEGKQDDDPEGKAMVCVAFGPQYGPVTAMQVEELIRATSRRGYDDLVIAGFSFDGPAQAVIEEAQHPSLRIHAAHIRPDVNPGMEGLLKDQPGSQLFTVFGQPRTRVEGPDGSGEFKVIMEGVDIYNPVDNTITPTGADKVAAWFIDGDYDGWTFCITQAFFPDKSAWKKLSKVLKEIVDPDRFEAFSGMESLPFPAGKHKRVAVKVIDPRGNEVMRVHRLGE